jgi:SNF2 family DNA or RNA helicase
MNYEQVVNDYDFIRKLPRGFIVTDEATAIKSFKSKRSKAVKSLKSPFNFALTGTPVENGKAEELYSIMQFVDPTVFGNWLSFENDYVVRNHFGGVQKYKNLNVMNEKLKTACVRKRQEDPDVSPFLPETIYAEPIWVPMDRATKLLYRQIADELLQDLDEAVHLFGNVDIFSFENSDRGGPMDELKGRLMPKLIAMRMICDHPLLVRTSANTYKNSKGVEGSGYAHQLLENGKLDKLGKLPKLEVLKETVIDFLSASPKNKLVIFTSFVAMTDFIAKDLNQFEVRTYTGKMSALEKEKAKVEFQTDPNIRILVSSDAGGYGVDLPQANMLINYDLPWNAGLAAQRNGRIRRASSEWKHVYIQDILIKDSIEQRQYDMLQQKMAVASAIVDGEGITANGGVSVSLSSLRQFLSEA